MMEGQAWFIIAINGVTCGGKTTLAHGLQNLLSQPEQVLSDVGIRTKVKSVQLINQDDYFLPQDSPKHTFVEAVQHINWEIITALDMERMYNDIQKIIKDDFLTSSSNQIGLSEPSAKNNFQKEGLNILILEGFLLFKDPFILGLSNLKFHIHIPFEKCLERRMVRSYDPPDPPNYFESIVWPYYEIHLREISSHEEVLFLNGELPQKKLLKFVVDTIKNSLKPLQLME